MPIELTFDTREAVPESLKDHVAEKDGKFVFAAEPASAVEETKRKYTKLSGDLDGLRKKLGKYSKFEELGDEFDAEEFLSLRELKRQGKPLTADEKAELERVHQKALAKATAEATTAAEKLKAYESELKRYKLTDPIRAIATSEKVGMFPEDFDLAWSEIGKRFRLDEGENGKSKIVILDEDGDPTDIKIEDFFTKLYKQQRPKFFKASGSGGSGAPTNQTSGGGNSKSLSRTAFDQLDPTARMKFIKDGGQVVEG